MRWIITAAVLSLTLATGCKKDEPAADKDKAAEADKNKTSGDNTAESGESSDKSTAGVKDPKPAASDKVLAPAPKVDLDGDIVGVAWIPGVDALFGLVKAKADKFGFPLPLTKEAALAQVQAGAKLKSLDWLALDKPILVVAFNPKKYSSNNGAILIPIKGGADAVKAALPEDFKADEGGNALAAEIAGEKVYVNFQGDHAVVTGSGTIFGEKKDAIAGAAKAYKGTGAISIMASATNLRTIFKDELGMMRKQIADLKPMLIKELEREMPMPGMGGMDKLIDFYVDMLNTTIEESDQISIALDVGDDGNWSLPIAVSTKSGGKLSELAGKLANADLSYAKGVPANAWLAFGGHMDPKAFDGLMKYSMDMVTGMLKLSEDEASKLKGQMDGLMALQDGRTWVAFYADGNFPMAIAGATGTADGAKYEKLFNEYLSLILGKAMTLAKDVMPPQLAGLPTDDFGKLITALNTLTSAAGVRMEAGTKKDGDVSVSSLSITADLDLIAKVAGPAQAAEVKRVTDILGNKIEFAMAYGPKNIGMAVGPNAAKTAADVAKGSAGSNTALVNRFPAGTAMFMHVDVNNTMAAWKPVMKMAMSESELAAVPTFPKGTSAGFTMGAAKDTLSMSMYGSVDDFIQLGMKAFMLRDGGAVPPSAPVEIKAAQPAVAPTAVPAVEKKEAAPADAPKAEPTTDDKAEKAGDTPAEGGLKAGAGVVPAK